MPQQHERGVRISWSEALQLLASGGIEHVGQTHGRTVTLVDSKGRRYLTQEPAIDATLEALRKLPAHLRQKITVVTE